jgi:hypothetical protein
MAIVLIIGGDPSDLWDVRAYVSPKHKPFEEMRSLGNFPRRKIL